jgi:hypothetical protein
MATQKTTKTAKATKTPKTVATTPAKSKTASVVKKAVAKTSAK